MTTTALPPQKMTVSCAIGIGYVAMVTEYGRMTQTPVPVYGTPFDLGYIYMFR